MSRKKVSVKHNAVSTLRLHPYHTHTQLEALANLG